MEQDTDSVLPAGGEPVICCDPLNSSECISLWFLQRVCQGERAGGEETRIPEAPKATANRERVDWVPGVDLQSRLKTISKITGFQICHLAPSYHFKYT